MSKRAETSKTFLPNNEDRKYVCIQSKLAKVKSRCDHVRLATTRDTAVSSFEKLADLAETRFGCVGADMKLNRDLQRVTGTCHGASSQSLRQSHCPQPASDERAKHP